MIPNYGDTYDAEALYSPDQSVTGEDLPELPPAVVLGFQDTLRETVTDRAEPLAAHPARQFEFYGLSESVAYVPVEEIGVGAPVAAVATEKAIAAGARVVVMLGGCAAFQPDIDPDTVLLPTRAVRDEGVSYHYLPAEEPVTATPRLLDQLAESFEAEELETARGPTWTTSALFRETVPEIDHYRERGFVSLCMESAAIWAVCQYRGVDAATVHHADDYLSREAWITDDDRERDLADLLDPTVQALEAYVDRE
ncbi:MAG: uridine phosphorylase [Haloarculaceae archaeon]|jgi:uridine phosphorylase